MLAMLGVLRFYWWEDLCVSADGNAEVHEVHKW